MQNSLFGFNYSLYEDERDTHTRFASVSATEKEILAHRRLSFFMPIYKSMKMSLLRNVIHFLIDINWIQDICCNKYCKM